MERYEKHLLRLILLGLSQIHKVSYKEIAGLAKCSVDYVQSVASNRASKGVQESAKDKLNDVKQAVHDIIVQKKLFDTMKEAEKQIVRDLFAENMMFATSLASDKYVPDQEFLNWLRLNESRVDHIEQTHQGLWQTCRISTPNGADELRFNVGLLNIIPRSIREGIFTGFKMYYRGDSVGGSPQSIYGKVLPYGNEVYFLGARQSTDNRSIVQMVWDANAGADSSAHADFGFGIITGYNTANTPISAHVIARFIAPSDQPESADDFAKMEQELREEAGVYNKDGVLNIFDEALVQRLVDKSQSPVLRLN